MSAGFTLKWRAIISFRPKSKHRLIRHRHTWIKRLPEKKSSRNEARPHTIDKCALRTAHRTKEKVGGPTRRPADLQVGRPAHGPHRLKFVKWQPPIGSQCRFKWFYAEFTAEQRVAPFYKYEGRGSISWHGEIGEELLHQHVVHLHL